MGGSASDAFGFLVAALIRNLRFVFLTSLSFRPHRCWTEAVRTALLSCLTIYSRLFMPFWLSIRWLGWRGSTEPLHQFGFAMNKEIEDKVKELSRRIVGTGQIVVTAESLTGGMISAA